MLLWEWNKITIRDIYSSLELIFSVKKSAEKLKVKPRLVFSRKNHKIRYVTKLGNLPYFSSEFIAVIMLFLRSLIVVFDFNFTLILLTHFNHFVSLRHIFRYLVLPVYPNAMYLDYRIIECTAYIDH